MTADILYLLILIIVIFGFLWEQILDFLNSKWFKKPIPEILKDIYDNDKYKNQQNYMLENYKFGIITSSLAFVILISMLVFQGFAYIDFLAGEISQNYILKPIIFFALIFLALDILNTPFDIYDTFVIEKKYGFNKTSVQTYIFDKLKGYIVSAIIGFGLLALIIQIYNLDPKNFWFYTWLVIVAFSVFMNMFYSVLIVPLFNKQTPLEEGELKTKITEFSKKAGFNLSKIFVIDGSKRSTKANAYFSGMGSKKRIVLYDTLINELTSDEIVAVLAHEIGHYKHKDIYKSMFASILTMGIFLYIFGILAGNSLLSQALGLEEVSFHIAILAFSMLYTPISEVLSAVLSVFSRKAECKADNFARKHGLSENLISALKKLTANNMGNLTPHPLVVFLSYSHPPIFDRIKNLSE